MGRWKRFAAPGLAWPVLIVESDDWGPGDASQAEALLALRALLARFTDCLGRPAVMTIGVVLSVPDPQAIAATLRYHARFLDDWPFRPILEALLAGEREGVFELQLHGMAHFWPANFMAAWSKNEALRRWLAEDGWRTEKLPAWLQSRWVLGLPSRSLPPQAIAEAVQEEVARFARCFGRPPKVAVPPTFVWDENLERAYAEAGVRVLITPGKRYPGRDAQGKLLAADRSYVNGERLPCGLSVLVRDLYFEPALGHGPEAVLEQVVRKWQKREPALLETHRFNFLDGHLQASLEALGALLEGALARLPGLRFMSSRELAEELAEGRAASWLGRLRAFAARCRPW